MSLCSYVFIAFRVVAKVIETATVRYHHHVERLDSISLTWVSLLNNQHKKNFMLINSKYPLDINIVNVVTSRDVFKCIWYTQAGYSRNLWENRKRRIRSREKQRDPSLLRKYDYVTIYADRQFVKKNIKVATSRASS